MPQLTHDGTSLMIHPGRSCRWCSKRSTPIIQCRERRQDAGRMIVELVTSNGQSPEVFSSQLGNLHGLSCLAAAYDCKVYQLDPKV